MPRTQTKAIDLSSTLDHGPNTRFQITVVILAALAIVMDGFDGQLIGYAIPLIIKEWGISRGAFAPAVAAGLVGMGIGSACAGLFADRFGRRWALIGSVFLFGIATCAIGFAQDIAMIAALRFVAGLGIGGALPSSTTMTAEFTPLRRRTLAVTATIVCVPVGGMLAGFFAAAVLPVHGWRGLFLMGGALPIVLGLVLLWTLPESPRFLVRHPKRWPELRALLGRMSRPSLADSVFSDPVEQKAEAQTGFRALFGPRFVRDTSALWVVMFMILLAIYSAYSWLPAMLSAEGLDVGLASAGLTAYNVGGIFGALFCALAIGRFGSRWPMLVCCLLAAGSALFLQRFSVKEHTTLLIGGLAVHGLFVSAVNATLYALCAHIYPTAVRATGTASALAFGRLGAILSAFAGAAVITAGGSSAYLLLLGVSMLLVFLALAVIRDHIPPVVPNHPTTSTRS